MQIAKRFFKPLEPRRILVIQLGDIGDVVWSLPALQAIGETYPEASVAVLLREGNGALLKADAMPPAVFEVRKALGGLGHLFASMGLVLALRRQRFDLVFDLRGDERGGYTAFATGAPIRAAHYYPNLAWPRNQLFTHLVTLPVDSQPIQRAAAASLEMLRAFDIESTTVVPKLCLSAETRLCAAKLLAEEGIVALQDRAFRGMGTDWLSDSGGATAGKNDVGERQEGVLPSADRKGAAGHSWVTVNPFSRWSYKEWRPDRWVQVIDWLRRQFGLTTVIVGTAGERENAARIAAACSGPVHNLAGKSTLGELAGILERSRLHIGVDSAAPHIAAAVGTPTVTLYGPSDWRYWAPPGENHRVVTPTLDCAPCHRKGCESGGMSRCLDELAVERVQAVIGAALSS